ncbi:uncharacterized protein LOC119740280 [Patiria miniata]|uniref:Ig-like domain-containing protein n=1 Tax=Patiria miniata TaxID=46514 RepID=A0A914B5U7_PATMI|nr:uncharacterized protein LOC119740280 [Patiria miniata]
MERTSSPFGRLGRRVIQCCSYVLLSFLCGIYSSCTAQYTSDPFAVSPQDTVAARGQTVVLRCALRPDMAGAIVLWSHFDPTTTLSFNGMLDAQINSELRDRVTVIGKRSSGEFNLRISNLRETDTGRYECRALIGLMNIVRRSATLTVVVPPDPGYPQCSMQPPSGLIPGQMVILTCHTRGGKPPPKLNWHRGPHQIGTPTTTTNVQRYTMRPVDYGVVFECRENGMALPLERSCTLVPLPTYLTVDITPRDPVIKVGESETFGCNAQGALIITYSWYINRIPLVMSPLIERFVLGGADQLISVYNAVLSLDDTVITCVATANTGQVTNASSILNVVPRQSTPTTWPDVTAVVPSTTRPLFGTLSPSAGTDGPAIPGGPSNPRPGRPGRPNRPGGNPGRPGHDRPEYGDQDEDSREDDSGDDLTNFDRNNDDRERENLAGSMPYKTVTVIGAAMAGLVISVVIVATIRLMTRVRPGTKDALITISGSSDSDEIEPNSLSTNNRNTFSSMRSTISCDFGDPKRITFSDLNREYDLPPFEPDDSLSYLGLRPESMISTRYTYEGLHSSDMSTSIDQARSVRYYEISSGEYDHSMEYEDVVSEQNSMSESGLRPLSILTDEGLHPHSVNLPVPGYNSRISISNRGHLL